LIELLVVIAVIALLLGLLLPALTRSKAEARKAQCLSQLRQVALAIELYASDNEQRFPLNYDGLAGRELVPNWAYGNMADPADRRDADSLADPARTLLAPYLKDPRLFKCPADRTDAVRSLSLNCRVNPVRLNAEPRWLWGAGTNYPTFRRSQDMTSPSLTFTVLDEEEAMTNDGYFAVDLSNTGDPYGEGTPVPLTIMDFPARRHVRGVTVAFGDGHVEWVRWRDALIHAQTRYPGLRVNPASFDGRWLHDHAIGQSVSFR
jgi:prepilin-type processing-associated H-X9-DG protein